MVVVGHSMGSCISWLLVTDSGDKLWMKLFGRPPDEVPLSPHVKAYFKNELFFQHRREIGRVILIAAPLRGSHLASGFFGRIGTWLVKKTRLHHDASNEMLRHTSIEEDKLKPKRRANSVDTLSPKSRFVPTINTIPVAPGIPVHTIIGDRGRGDSPNSSDGIVPYWSSHKDHAASDCIVPSHHSATKSSGHRGSTPHPQAPCQGRPANVLKHRRAGVLL